MAKDGKEQISVPISAEVRAAIERAAAAEHRTTAAMIRVWIFAGLADRLGAKHQQAALEDVTWQRQPLAARNSAYDWN